MNTRFAIFMQAEDGSIWRIFDDTDFATEPEAESYLSVNIEVFGADKTYLLLKIRLSQ